MPDARPDADEAELRDDELRVLAFGEQRCDDGRYRETLDVVLEGLRWQRSMAMTTDAEFRKVAALRFACVYLGKDLAETPLQLEAQMMACIGLGVLAADELIRQLKETEKPNDKD